MIIVADQTHTLIVGALDDNGSGKLRKFYTRFGFVMDPIDSSNEALFERKPLECHDH
jgi:hypothetical protein